MNKDREHKAPGPTFGNEYGRTLPFTILLYSMERVFGCLLLKFVARVFDVDDVRQAASLAVHRVRISSVGGDNVWHRRL